MTTKEQVTEAMSITNLTGPAKVLQEMVRELAGLLRKAPSLINDGYVDPNCSCSVCSLHRAIRAALAKMPDTGG